jgi:hypothetical protein
MVKLDANGIYWETEGGGSAVKWLQWRYIICPFSPVTFIQGICTGVC